MNEPNSIETIFGLIGIATGTFFYILPLFTIYNLKKGTVDVEETSGMRMFSSFICSFLWIVPSILKEEIRNNYFLYCNCLGALLNFCWTILYLYYFTKNNKFRYSIYIIAVIDIIIEISLFEWDLHRHIMNDQDKLIAICKWVAAGFNIVMYFTPGLNVIRVFKNKNRKLISIYGCFLGALNTGAWMIYGKVDDDKQLPLIVANIAGFGLCVIQIVIYFALGKNDLVIQEEIRENSKGFQKFDVIKEPSKTEEEDIKKEDDIFKDFI